MKTLHLVLTHHWFDQTTKSKDPKRIEYRSMTTLETKGPNRGMPTRTRWYKLIYEQREKISRVRFARGYTKTTATFAVSKIDIGPCPIPGWAGDYIRIHFTDLPQ